MDIANLIVQIGVLVGTLGAAAVAWWQAKVAADSRREAASAQEKAEAAANRAASAAERSADAEERAASAGEERAAIERAREARREPFEVTKQAGGVWRLWNRLEEIVTITNLDGSEGDTQYVEVHNGLPDYLKPGQALAFNFGGGMADPASVQLTVAYSLASANVEDLKAWHSTLV